MRKDSLEGMYKDSDVIARRADMEACGVGGKGGLAETAVDDLALARETPHNLKERVAGQPRGDACRQCNQQPPISDDGDAPACA
jgi:hypothetical protein